MSARTKKLDKDRHGMNMVTQQIVKGRIWGAPYNISLLCYIFVYKNLLHKDNISVKLSS